MRKAVALILVLYMLLCLCACEAAEADTNKVPEGFLAGYGRTDITPVGSVDMGGRMSTGVLTWLNIDAIAITGTNDATAILLTVDATGIKKPLADEIRKQISEEHGIPREAIFISATHTHSEPSLTGSDGYSETVIEGAVESARLAMLDRAPAEMYIATVKTENMNFVRNYLMKDGSYAGSNFGNPVASEIVAHETEADPDLQLIKFVREGSKTVEGNDAKDIIIANFQGHPHRGYNVAPYYTLLSANVPFFFREELAKELDCHVSYFTGASGNVNMESRIQEENVTTDQKDQGKRLAQYALEAEDQYTKVTGSTVEYVQMTATLTVDHSRDHLVNAAAETLSVRSSKGDAAAKEFALANGLAHYMEAKVIIDNAAKGETEEMEIGAISIGDVAFIAPPYEMYDTTGMNIKNASPFDMTFVLYLCNGQVTYMPDDKCFDHGGYGVYSCVFVRGTAEQLEGHFLDMLNELHDKY